MSKLTQVLALDPAHELRFQGPYTSDVNSRLELSNPTDRPVAFKVKTTAPKRYCVRPNSGIIDPKQTMKLVVILRALDEDQLTDQVKDKFMVQSMFCDDGEVWNESLFKEASPDQLMDSKIRCVFDPPKPKVDEKGEELPPTSSASDVIAQLRDENSRLNREKLELLEECAKLRRRPVVSDNSPATHQVATAEKPPGINLTMEILAVAFLITFVIALFIGKAIL
ncbi:unnamed protein product [Notodromas monacha]|uniref:MSP domain-containing protein n=1 Tax=Notodromas monacha TaxID=399045 RepID=A0A7R9BG11_9CRUS|nr:unnamed protein product [Notodromas monacha]CAG0913169.1 unnamed protein product [Notodromas monacha]